MQAPASLARLFIISAKPQALQRVACLKPFLLYERNGVGCIIAGIDHEAKYKDPWLILHFHPVLP